MFPSDLYWTQCVGHSLSCASVTVPTVSMQEISLPLTPEARRQTERLGELNDSERSSRQTSRQANSETDRVTGGGKDVQHKQPKTLITFLIRALRLWESLHT